MRLIHQDTETQVDMGGNHGDYDLGREFSKRFTWQGTDKKFRTITYSYWVEARDAENNEVKPEDEDELISAAKQWEERRENYISSRRFGTGFTEALRRWDDENPRPIRYHWCEVGESGIHDDEDEVVADEIEYGEGSVFTYDTKEEAEDAAKAECDTLEARDFSPENII